MTEPEQESPTSCDALPPARFRRLRRWGTWLARLLLVLLLLLGGFLSTVPTGRALLRGAVLLPSLLTTSETAPLFLAGEPISHTRTTLTAPSGKVLLDVFSPRAAPPPVPGSREAVVMITGVGDNRKNPELVNLSEALARVGVVVVNMTTPYLIGFVIQPTDEAAVLQAFQFAARQPGVNPQHIGIVGFSGGAALACLAAADPRIRNQVSFLLTFGAFYNATNLLRDFGRRAITSNGQMLPFHPGPDPIIVMSNLVGETLPPGERRLFVDGLRPGGTPLAHLDQVLTTPGAAAAYHLIAGDHPDPSSVARNLAALSPAVKQLLAALSPSRVLPYIRCPIYLLQAHNDPFIPFTEGRDFAAALTRLGHVHQFVEFGIFHHTQLISGFGLGPLLTDGSKLFRILTAVLRPSA